MHRAAKVSLWALAGIAGLVVASFGVLQTEVARDRLAAMVSNMLSAPGSTVRIGKIEGTVPIDMRVARIDLGDKNGTWLTVDQAALVWSPTALLTGRVRIDTLSAASITVLRAPAPSQSTSSSGLSLPKLPVSVDLRRLAVGRFILSPAVAGGDNAEASIEANGLLTRNHADLSVRLARTDNHPGAGILEAHFDQAANALKLKLDIDEPTGILMDAAMARTDRLPLRVLLNGDGPLSGWKGKFELTAGPTVRSIAALEIAQAQGTRLAIKGDTALGVLLADNLRPIVGEDFTFDIAASQDDKGGVTLAPSRITFAAVSLEAQGNRSDKGELAGRAHIAAANLAPVGAAAGQQVQGTLGIDLTVAGTVDRPNLTLTQQGQLVFGQIGVDGLAIDAKAAGKGGAAAKDAVFDLALNAKASNLRDTATGQNYGPLTIGFTGTANAQGTEILARTLSAEGGGVLLKGTGSFKNGAAEGKLSLQASDLSVLGKMFDQTAGGAATFDIEAKSDAARTINITLNGTGERLRTGIPAADALLAGSVRLEGTGSRAADGAISLNKLALTSSRFGVNGDGRFTPATGALQGTVSANLPDLKALSAAVSSPLAGTGALSAKIGGTLDTPAVDADLTLDRLVYGATRVDHLDAKVRSPQGFAGRTTISGRIVSGRLSQSMDGTLSRETAGGGTAYRLEQLRLAGTGGTVDASLVVDPARPRIGGRIAVAIADLSTWSGIAGGPLAGSLSLTADLPANGAPGPIKATVERLALGSAQQATGIAHAGLNGTVSGDLARRTGSLDLVVTGFSANGAAITNADAHVAAKSGDTDFRLHAAGHHLHDALTADIAGTATDARGVTTVRLMTLATKLGKNSLSLTRPTTISIAPQNYRVAGLGLNLDGGTIEGEAALSPRSATANLNIRQLPLRPLGLLAGNPSMAGTLDGRVALSGTPQRPDAHITLSTKGLDLQTDGPQPRPELSLTANADWQGDRVTMDIRAVSGTGNTLTVTGSAPLAFDLANFTAGKPRDPGLALKINGGGRLQNLMSIVPLGEDRVTGAFTVNVNIGGTMAAPQPDGRIAVTGGHYANMALGTELDGIDLAIVGDGSRFRLDHLTATDGKTGKMQASGAVDLGVTPAKVDLSLGFTDMLVARGDNMTINANGDLKLAGVLKELAVSGTLKVNKAELYIPDRLPATVVVLDVHEIGGRQNGEQPKEEPLAPIALKIALDAPGQVFVRGHGVVSEWRGHVDVSGTTAAPVLAGQLAVVNGSVSLLGQTFNIDRGVIGFTGSTPIDPTLNVQASASASGITAQVNVTGTANNPKLALSSTPTLPRDEILARVLFGSNVGSLTPSQGIQLAAAAASLASGGPSVLDKVRSSIGLDRLDLGSSSANTSGTQGTAKGTVVTGGKYIANGVFVGMQQGLTGDSGSRVIVEVEITPNISVNSTFGSRSGSGFGAKYSIDY
jgi:translocation and assembly module TamB